MATSSPATPVDPARFGRRSSVRPDLPSMPAARPQDDLRLFAATFAAGFLFVSILIG